MAAPVVAPSIVTVAASVVAPSPPVTAKVINFVPVTNACVPAAASVCAPGLTVKLLNEASCANVAAAAFTVTVSANTAPLTPTPPVITAAPDVFEVDVGFNVLNTATAAPPDSDKARALASFAFILIVVS